MTRFCLASDLHLEQGALIIDNTNNADCLILAGDIVEFCNLAVKNELMHSYIDTFFQNVSDQFDTVLWVPGNHEWYCSTYPNAAYDYLERMNVGNIKIMMNDTAVIKDVPVHCSTLWTDFKKSDPIAMQTASTQMNDYRYIQRMYKHVPITLSPSYVYELHLESVEYLLDALTDTRKSVVVTHHSPLMQTIQCEGSYLDYSYGSDLSGLILDHPHITNWCFGHAHNRVEYPIGDTIVRSNCRGYHRYEKIAKTFAPIYFDV